MRINKIHLFILFSLLGLVSSCKDDTLFVIEEEYYGKSDGTMPLEFNVTIDNEVMTRGVENSKQAFEPGDVIHIQGTFTIDETSGEDNTGVPDGDDTKTISIYSAMILLTDDDTGKNIWKPCNNGLTETDAVKLMNWPNEAIKATFKAYYVAGSDYFLKTGVPHGPILLSELTEETDPLEAYTPDVRYGHAINLNFTHACTYLTIEELPDGETDYFWFTRVNQVDGKPLTDFNNAFQINVSEDGNLTLEFVQVPDNNYDQVKVSTDNSGKAVYVEGRAERYLPEDGGKGYKNKVGFYLQPENYNSFLLEYPGSAPSIHSYLTYMKTVSPSSQDDDGNQYLEANKTYTLNISKSPGVTFVGESADQGWDENEDRIVIVDVEKFLWAATHGEGYYQDEDEILRPIDGGTRLIRNIDFKFRHYDAFAPREDANHSDTWWTPDLNNILFDGGKHYIWNVGSPIFNNNQGTIQNLGIKNVKAEIASRDNFKDEMTGDPLEGYPGIDLSTKGIICNTNDNGIIDNIRIVSENGEPLQYDLKSYTSTSQNSQSHGFIVGLNKGSINQIDIEGDIVMTFTRYDGEGFYQNDYEDHNLTPTYELPGLNVGGIIGQNTGTGIINKVSPIENMSITIINNCEGTKGGYYFGGIVGNGAGGTISQVIIPKLTIDGSHSSGNVSYMGGMVGQLPDSRNSLITSCNVVGSIKAGSTKKEGDAEAKAYIGGIAGLVTLGINVNNCNTVVDVTGGDITSPNEDVAYATGGVFGFVNTTEQTPGVFESIISNGSVLVGVAPNIGNFAGIAPAGTWEAVASNNITLRQHRGIDAVGKIQ